MKNLNYKILMLFLVIISFENFFCMNQQNKENSDLEITEKNEAIDKFNKELKERSKLEFKTPSSMLYKLFLSERKQFANEKSSNTNINNTVGYSSIKDLNHIVYEKLRTSNTLKLIVATTFMTYGISKLLKTNYDLGIKYSDFTKYKNGSFPLFLSSMLLLRSSNNVILNFLINTIESDIKEKQKEINKLKVEADIKKLEEEVENLKKIYKLREKKEKINQLT